MTKPAAPPSDWLIEIDWGGRVYRFATLEEAQKQGFQVADRRTSTQ